MRTIKSKPLKKSKINAAIRALTESERARVVADRWEYVPSSAQTDHEKLTYIVASIPMAGNHDPETLAAVLRLTPPFVNQRTYPFAKPNLYATIVIREPDLARELTLEMRRHKHVPPEILANDEWVGLVAVGTVFDFARGRGIPLDDASVESFLAAARLWLDATRA